MYDSTLDLNSGQRQSRLPSQASVLLANVASPRLARLCFREYLDPPLQGFRLRGRTYVRLKPDQDGGLASRELGLRLRLEEREVRFYRLDTGEPLLTPAEARRAAEAEVARLREELRRRSRS